MMQFITIYAVQSFPLSVFPAFNCSQYPCVSSIISNASFLGKHFSLNPKAFKGLSSGVLYQRNHSLIPIIPFTYSTNSSIVIPCNTHIISIYIVHSVNVNVCKESSMIIFFVDKTTHHHHHDESKNNQKKCGYVYI